MGLYQNMQEEPVTRLAVREPVLCRPDESVRVAIWRMRDQGLGCVIVVDEERKPIGMLTESMVTQLLSHDPSRLDGPVRSCMSETWPWVKETDPIALVLEAMQAKNVRFICIVDDDGCVSGLTGQKGLMEYVAEHFPQQVMVQRIGSPPLTDREGA